MAGENLRIVEDRSESQRHGRNLIRNCNSVMRLLDRFEGSFAIISLHALFTVLGV